MIQTTTAVLVVIATERIQVEGEEGTDHTHEVTTAHHNHAANSVLASR